jgi:hypothetical protein
MCEKVFYDSIDLHQFRCFFFSFCKTNKEESIETRVGIKIGERNVKAPLPLGQGVPLREDP